jgi:hypothetical protein
MGASSWRCSRSRRRSASFKTRRSKHRTKTRSLLGFKEPNSDVVEDNLIQIFSQLSIQVAFLAEKCSAHTGEILENENMRLLVDETMPEVFFFRIAGRFCTTGMSQGEVPVSFLDRCRNLERNILGGYHQRKNEQEISSSQLIERISLPRHCIGSKPSSRYQNCGRIRRPSFGSTLAR